MARKEKTDYKGSPPNNLYVVWVDGRWRFYTNPTIASKRFVQMSGDGKPTQLLRFEAVEIIGEANITK
jgi:hypothetical protein